MGSAVFSGLRDVGETTQFAIVIPAYNRERFIRAAIDSALSQTVPADEIIVVDDGSTDRTAEIAGTYGPPVRVIRIENNGSGPSRPRNVGIAAARSRYITLLDSDDRLAPTVLERHREALRLSPKVGLVCGNFYTIRLVKGRATEPVFNVATIVHGLEKQEIAPATYSVRSSVAYQGCCAGNFICTPGTTFPQDVWEGVGGFDESMRVSEDFDFFIRVLRAHDLVYIDEPLSAILRHDENIFSWAEDERRPPLDQYANHGRVLARELAWCASDETKAVLRTSIQNVVLDRAHQRQEFGRYFRSATAYLEFMARGGTLRVGLLSIAKLPARWLAREFRAARNDFD
jgi:glycosyltransferase involved in cell wall biosynthesis